VSFLWQQEKFSFRSLIWFFFAVGISLCWAWQQKLVEFRWLEFSFTLYAENRQKLSGGRNIFFAELRREKQKGIWMAGQFRSTSQELVEAAI
jgi:hypothetical protein